MLALATRTPRLRCNHLSSSPDARRNAYAYAPCPPHKSTSHPTGRRTSCPACKTCRRALSGRQVRWRRWTPCMLESCMWTALLQTALQPACAPELLRRFLVRWSLMVGACMHGWHEATLACTHMNVLLADWYRTYLSLYVPLQVRPQSSSTTRSSRCVSAVC